jgi:hypothetical protein
MNELIVAAIGAKVPEVEFVADSDNLELFFSRVSLEELADFTDIMSKDAVKGMETVAARIRKELTIKTSEAK